MLVGSVFFSPQGYQSGYFLGVVNVDLVQAADKISWTVGETASVDLAEAAFNSLLVSL